MNQQLPALTEIYKHLHRNPELSRHEDQTSAFLAGELRKLGYSVTEHLGKYDDGLRHLASWQCSKTAPGLGC